MHLFLPLHP